MPVPYNGSVARLNFGFLSAARVRRWLHDGTFDVIHIHEPTSPSLGLLTCWAARGPIVATFHTSNPRSRAMIAAYPILQPALEKISARIAVSEYARRTLVEHLGGDAVVIPNGVDVDFFARAEPKAEWQGGTLGFIGRIDEPRKGLPVLMKALPAILAARPETRLLVAGRGDEEEAVESLPKEMRERVEFLGMVSDEDKARLLRSVDVYVAPNTGGESFGIILVEALSAGAPVLASDLDAFGQVLDHGTAGDLFANEDAEALATAAIRLLGDPERRAGLRERGSAHVRRFDWSTVGADILAVYETVPWTPMSGRGSGRGSGWRRGTERGRGGAGCGVRRCGVRGSVLKRRTGSVVVPVRGVGLCRGRPSGWVVARGPSGASPRATNVSRGTRGIGSIAFVTLRGPSCEPPDRPSWGCGGVSVGRWAGRCGGSGVWGGASGGAGSLGA